MQQGSRKSYRIISYSEICARDPSTRFELAKALESALLDTRHEWGTCYNSKWFTMVLIIQQEYINAVAVYIKMRGPRTGRLRRRIGSRHPATIDVLQI